MMQFGVKPGSYYLSYRAGGNDVMHEEINFVGGTYVLRGEKFASMNHALESAKKAFSLGDPVAKTQ